MVKVRCYRLRTLPYYLCLLPFCIWESCSIRFVKKTSVKMACEMTTIIIHTHLKIMGVQTTTPILSTSNQTMKILSLMQTMPRTKAWETLIVNTWVISRQQKKGNHITVKRKMNGAEGKLHLDSKAELTWKVRALNPVGKMLVQLDCRKRIDPIRKEIVLGQIV